jgi:tRNA1(Val) A37 N6-methylase TrmN6
LDIDDEIMALFLAELKQAGDKPIDIKKQMVQMVEQSLNLNTYEDKI